jgi:cytochrome P450
LAYHGSSELYTQYCDPVTNRVVAAMLGIDSRDEEWFVNLETLRNTILSVMAHPPGEHPPQEQIDAAVAAAKAYNATVQEVVLECRERGTDGDDFISLLWREAEVVFGEGYTPVDIAAGAIQFMDGANSTGAVTACNGLYLAASRPGLQQRVLEGEPQARANFAEETLRLHAAGELRPRRAQRDIEVGGAQIRKGEMVTLLLNAANRDESRYPHPTEVDLDRSSPRDHFGLLKGRRTCAGQSLARYQLERVLAVALERLPNLRLDPDAEQPAYTGLVMRTWRPLNVLFDAPAES